ncbi:hypothetical protein SH661x_003497 [Planctomicrobium sp. SH661]|uniref:hypothetical protein n=1 Tax=Planctomicrobium sp. SH661 TaxID=3448124 RepID=UPI003F5C6C6C
MSEHPPQVPGEPIEDRMLVKTGVLWASAIGLATLVVVSLGLMRAFQLAMSTGAPTVHPIDAQEQLSLISRMAPLDPNQREQRKKYEIEQAALLNNYSWVDQKQNIARIPVDRAMALIVQQYGKAE